MSTDMRVGRGSRVVRHGVQHINQTYKVKEYGRRTTSYTYAVADDGEIPEIAEAVDAEYVYGQAPTRIEPTGMTSTAKEAMGNFVTETHIWSGTFMELINGVPTAIPADGWEFHYGGGYIDGVRLVNRDYEPSDWITPPAHAKKILREVATQILRNPITVNSFMSLGYYPLFYAQNCIARYDVVFQVDIYTYYDDDGNIVPGPTDHFTITEGEASISLAPRHNNVIINQEQAADFPHRYKVTETEV